MHSETRGTSYKFVVVLNKKLEAGVALNATAHMAAALMRKANDEQRSQMKFLEYMDGSGQAHLISGLSLIVLRADNSNKLRQARENAVARGLLYVDFTESMTGGTYVEQMERTALTPESELNYYGICMFGEKSEIDPLTAKFSLWK